MSKVIKNTSIVDRVYNGQLIESSTGYIIDDKNSRELSGLRSDQNLLDDLLNTSTGIVMAHSDDLLIEFAGQLGIDFLNMSIPKSPLIIFGQLINGEYAQMIEDTTYVTMFSFIDSNSSENGVPIKMSIDGDVDTATSYAIRLYDVTNSNVLVEKTGITSERGIVEIGRINGTTTDKAILEIQAKMVGNNKQSLLYSSIIEYD